MTKRNTVTAYKAKIIANDPVAPGYFRMSLVSPRVAEKAIPGQFLHVRVNNLACMPLLRRPLSIHRIGLNLENVELLYEVVGEGTKVLAEKKPGEELDVMGPLGTGFSFPEGRREAVLVAGGMGVAPLLALAEKIKLSQNPKIKKLSVILGARNKELLLCREEFGKLAEEVSIATDDGSEGHQGLATDILEELLLTMDHGLLIVFACGPEAMLQKVSAVTVNREVPCQMSLESQMGCGVGACRGCAVKIKSLKSKVEIYKMVCKDGPVFEAREIVWEK